MTKSIEELKASDDAVRSVLSPAVSLRQYGAIQGMYDILNKTFFDGALPEVVFLLDYGKHNVMGYFQYQRLSVGGEETSVISMNPDAFSRDTKDVTATLIHEMCHCWEVYVLRHVPRSGYHDNSWAGKMRDCGLEPVYNNPSRTSCTHRIIPDGAFETWWNTMSEDAQKSIVLLTGVFHLDENCKERTKRNKTAYQCPSCGSRMWGKSGMDIKCVPCDVLFEALDS